MPAARPDREVLTATGVADDYGNLAEGLLALHQATGDGRWLTTAGELLSTAVERFGAEDGGFHGFSLVYSTASEDEARKVFAALSEAGVVTMPLSKTFWSPCYGMVKDKFDVSWQVMVPGTPA